MLILIRTVTGADTPTTQNGVDKVQLAAAEALERSLDEDARAETSLVPRPQPVTSHVHKNARSQHAMEKSNLIRARAFCGFDFNGPRRRWANISKAEKTVALRKLDREFQGEDWAYGKLASIFLSVLKKLVSDNNRRLLREGRSATTSIDFLECDRSVPGDRAHLPVATALPEEIPEVLEEEPFPFKAGDLLFAKHICGLNIAERKSWEQIAPTEKYRALLLLSEEFEYTGWGTDIYEQLLKRIVQESNQEHRPRDTALEGHSAVKGQIAVKAERQYA
jgi:hypothetical protein